MSAIVISRSVPSHRPCDFSRESQHAACPGTVPWQAVATLCGNCNLDDSRSAPHRPRLSCFLSVLVALTILSSLPLVRSQSPDNRDFNRIFNLYDPFTVRLKVGTASNRSYGLQAYLAPKSGLADLAYAPPEDALPALASNGRPPTGTGAVFIPARALSVIARDGPTYRCANGSLRFESILPSAPPADTPAIFRRIVDPLTERFPNTTLLLGVGLVWNCSARGVAPMFNITGLSITVLPEPWYFRLSTGLVRFGANTKYVGLSTTSVVNGGHELLSTFTEAEREHIEQGDGLESGMHMEGAPIAEGGSGDNEVGTSIEDGARTSSPKLVAQVVLPVVTGLVGFVVALVVIDIRRRQRAKDSVAVAMGIGAPEQDLARKLSDP